MLSRRQFKVNGFNNEYAERLQGYLNTASAASL
jgi:hypothetical protein